MENKKQDPKKVAQGCAFLIGIILLIACLFIIFDSDDEKKEEVDTKKSELINEPETQDQFKERLIREIKYFEKPFNDSIYKTSIGGLQLEIVLFIAWAKIIEQSKEYNNDDISNLGNELKIKVEKRQLSEFPKIRKFFIKFLDSTFKANDIQLELSGWNKSILTLYSKDFSSKKYQNNLRDLLKENLKLFRFYQLRFSTNKKSTYFDIYEPRALEDNDIVAFIN